MCESRLHTTLSIIDEKELNSNVKKHKRSYAES
jgi:hypothetical protein